MVEDCPEDITLEISELIRKLLEVYRTHLPATLPNELLQYSHSLDLFWRIACKQAAHPTATIELQQEFIKEFTKVYSKFMRRMTLLNSTDVHKEQHPEKLFSNFAWKDNPYFEFLKRMFYLTKKYSLKWLHSIEDLDSKTKQQLHFYITNFVSYFSPTNYVWSNPEVIQAMVASGGKNLLRGFKNYLSDLIANNGQLNIRMTDLKAFKVGGNLAITPGKVVYQNDLMQLIQYTRSTDFVYEVPILFVPPWINKYYVLDLSPHNSIVKWLVAQGFTVYMISWVNPGPELANKEFADYMQEGPLQALDVVTKITNCSKVHMVGYCIGGTLLGATLAYMQKINDQRALSATFFMSLLNFSNPGELGVFLDDRQIDALEKLMQAHGYLDGRLLDIAFNILRPNDLIWPYFINNYLLGKPSQPFDLLYWNADSSNLPYKMYIFYLRNMYLHNRLRKPGGIVINDVPINLKDINIPAFFLASETDHITLWRSVYSGLSLLSGPVDFVLAESGHVRGVINPPSTQNKYNFRANPKYNKLESYPKKTQEWLVTAEMQNGSWWPYWRDWLLQHDEAQVPARMIDPSIVIEDAPGSYVLKRL